MLLLVLVACGAFGACGAPGDQGENVAESLNAIGITDACFAAPATGNNGRVITAGGEFTTAANYNATGCENGYVVDVMDYATSNNYGTAVAYAGPAPTDEVTCQKAHIGAYVWRRGSSGGIFKGARHAYGRWSFDVKNVGRCIRPAINLDERIEGYKPNDVNDYRIALTATLDGVRQPIAFSALPVPVLTPYAVIGELAEFRATFDVPAGTITPTVHTMWGARSTTNATTTCRALTLNRTLTTFTTPALVKAGVPQSTANAQNTALTNYFNALCTSSGTEATLQASSTEVTNAVMAVFNSLQTRFGSELGQAASDLMLANTIEQIYRESMGVLSARCALNAENPLKYAYDGTLPSGVAADRVLLGTCGNQTAAAAAQTLGIGGFFGSQTANTAHDDFVKCMRLSGDDRCNDPRADDAAPPPADANGNVPKPCRGSRADGSCTDAEHAAWLGDNCHGSAAGGACTPDEATAFQRKVDANDKADATLRNGVNQAQPAGNAATQSTTVKALTDLGLLFGTGTAVLNSFKALASPEPFSKVLTVPATIAALSAYTAAVVKSCDDFPEVCNSLLNGFRRIGDAYACVDAMGNDLCRPDGKHMCGPELGISGYFYTGSNGGQLDQLDRLNHCTCKLLDSAYAKTAGVSFPRAATCPLEEEREKHECVENPRTGGPNDGFNLKCLGFLQPGQLDLDAIEAKICDRLQLFQCNGDEGARFNQATRKCECLETTPGTGINPVCPRSPIATGGLCTQDNPQVCSCTPFFTPPNGGDPFCGYDPTRLPLPKDAWIMKDPDAAYATRFSTHGVTGTDAEALFVRTGGITALATPNLYANTFAQRGNKLRTKVAVRKAPAAGQNLLLQLYYTNVDENVIHAFAGQCNLNAAAVNAVSNCDITLPTVQRPNPTTGAQENVAIAGLGGMYNFEYVVQTAAAYKERVLLGPLSYTGTLTTTTNPVSFCPTPDPGPDGLPFALPPRLNPTFTELGPTWTFVNAGTGSIPRTIYQLSYADGVLR